MYLIDFNKQRMEKILAALSSGGSIPEPENGWNRYEMLQVAGAMYAGVWSQGPANMDGDRFEQLPSEYREATEETLTQDVHDAIEFCGKLAFMILDGEYDAQAEPHIQVMGSGKSVKFLKGGKQ